MNKTLRKVTIAAILVASSAFAEYIRVPESVRSHAVHYIRTKQLDKFSCGYNVLFNAANFETTLGFENPAHKYPVFEQRIIPYLQQKGFHPRGGTTNETIGLLAKKITLQPLYNLGSDDISLLGIAPMISGTVSISYTKGCPEREIQRRLDDAFRAKQDTQIHQVKEYLRTHDYAVVHFSCFVDDFDEGHAILVSLHQNESGRGLFVFDNINATMKESSQIMRYIEYLIYTFDISGYYTFSSPQLPNRWLHLDSNEGQARYRF